ncbi:hypothetical protein PGT21_011696 [Puccinia graminis f. sp. tritici]|uniref:Uncharacterized protein n=1 Tax=Puccinia graminis f. sp. tritici TaxID=56615 RepID=A0A5B0QID9_PUCGR|nr:hypothetical protein PGT21_011696 [Puccinia graminis f. sp. tritici]
MSQPICTGPVADILNSSPILLTISTISLLDDLPLEKSSRLSTSRKSTRLSPSRPVFSTMGSSKFSSTIFYDTLRRPLPGSVLAIHSSLLRNLFPTSILNLSVDTLVIFSTILSNPPTSRLWDPCLRPTA